MRTSLFSVLLRRRCSLKHCLPPSIALLSSWCPSTSAASFQTALSCPAGSAALACLSPGPCLLLCDLCVALPGSLMATPLSPSFLQSLGWRGYQTFSSLSPFTESHFFPESPLRASTFEQRGPVTRTLCTGLSQLSYTIRMLFRWWGIKEWNYLLLRAGLDFVSPVNFSSWKQSRSWCPSFS